MKTEELVSLLASRLEPVDARSARRRFLPAWAAGFGAAVALTLVIWRYNPSLPQEASTAMFCVRAAFCAGLALGAFEGVVRLAQPGVRLGRMPSAIALPVLSMWLLAAIALVKVPPQDRVALVLGHTALACPGLIALLAAPLFVAMMWSLQGYAPTRLRLAGAFAGLAAGAGGALAYTLHCPELAAPFLAVWYLLGMLIPTALGAVLGPRVLRW